MKMEQVIKCVVLLSLALSVSNAQRGSRNRCLKNLRMIGSTPSAITLGWDNKCTDDGGGMRYKVYYEHLEWQACPSGHQDESRGGPGRDNYETTETVMVFEHLHPFSAYKLTVKYRAEEESMIGETLQDVPGVLPEKSPIHTDISANSLKFYWRNPLPSKCEDFNGLLDGVNYVLKGTEKWNLAEEQSGATSENSRKFEHLSPFSSYILFLYSQNQEGKHNTDLPYRIKAKTSAARPMPPRKLADATEAVDKSQRLITWVPPYPPTGEIEVYSLRWKKSNSTHWQEEQRVYPGDALCPESLVDPAASQLNSTVCHVVGDLSASENYTFQVSAFNHGIAEHSFWSETLVSAPSTTEVILGLEKGVFIVVVVASLVGVLLCVLFLTFLSYHCSKKRGKKYKNVPNYVPGPACSTLTTSTSFSYPRGGGAMSPPHRSSFNTSQGSAATAGEAPLPPPSASSAQTEETLRRYKAHFLPAPGIDRNSRTGSIQEQPLPPLPPKDDHLYEELKLKQDPSPASSSKSRASSEAQYLRPTGLQLAATNLTSTWSPSKGSDLNESEYLAPRTAASASARSRNASSDTIDMDDYLKPTFDRFEHIDPTDMSPPREAPPPIPVVSYGTGAPAAQKF